MKKFHKLLVLCMLCAAFQLQSQQLHFSQGSSSFIYDLNRHQVNSEAKQRTVDTQQLPYLDHVVYYPEQISEQLTISKTYDFFQGLQNPFNSNTWVYLERQQLGAGYNLYLYDSKTKKRTILIAEKNADRVQLAYKPIGWTNDVDKIYLEALHLDTHLEHEGIYTYDLKTRQISKVPVPFRYMRTPLLSPDRNTLVFLSSNDKVYDPVHGTPDLLIEKDINADTHRIIHNSNGEALQLLGWKHHGKETSRKLSSVGRSSLDYYLPWDNGVALCVSRHGTPAPSGYHNYVSKCNRFGPGGHHGYAAIDFATSLSSDQNVRASASGTVTFSGISGSLSSGYGRLVIIRHSDGTRTYYAHNKTLLVSYGEYVEKGEVIALEGTTGGSTGDHIHFEWRAAGGNASTMGSFKGIGQPRQDYSYRSNNTHGSPVDNTPPTTSISAAGGTTHTGDFTVNFTDNDDTGVTRKFYQVLEKVGNDWLANRGNGFFNDNYKTFYSGYDVGTGNWSINNEHLLQTNTTTDNAKLSTFLSQNSGLPYLYQFSARVVSTSGPKKFGLHIMSDDASQEQRGNSYLIWFSGAEGKVRVYETVDNQLNSRAVADLASDNNWADYKITYSPGYGVLEIFKNNVSVLKWTDSSPISGGNYISYRTNQTAVEFDDLKVYKFRGSSATVTAGPDVAKDARQPSPDGTTATCKIKSLVRDAAGNWSAPGNLDIVLNFAAPATLAQTKTTQNNSSFIPYPNPTNGQNLMLKYDTSEEGIREFILSDINGKELKKLDVRVQQGTNNLDLKELIENIPPGKYIININGGTRAEAVKIIKE